MALVFKDRVKETTTTTGTGTVTLAGASDGFQAFTVIGNANTTYYTLVNGANFEVGLGTYTLSGTTLSRDTVLESSNSFSKISLSGTSDVFATYPASKAIAKDADGNTSFPASLEANVRYMSHSLGHKNIRVNGISAGPIKTLAAAGISGFNEILNRYEIRMENNKRRYK